MHAAALAVLLIAFASPSSAQAADANPAVASTRDALMAEFDRHFPEDGTVRPVQPGPIPCLTPLIQRMRLSWDDLTPADRKRVTGVLAPWKDDLFDSPAPPAPLPASSCLGQQGAHQLNTEHFVVEWDDDRVEGYTQDFADALEEAWAVEVEERGWPAPLSTPDYPISAYIAYDQDYWGAYTSADYCSGIGYVPYIWAGSASFTYGNWYQDMAAHEFNHAIQMSTAWSPELWWWEATATWVEEYVYPGHDSWGDYVIAYSYWPWYGMNAYSDRNEEIFYHMYGMAIANFRLDEGFGSHDVVRDTWTWAAANSDGQYDLTLEEILAGLGVDWEEYLLSFMAMNTVMDYADQPSFTPVELQGRITGLPAEGTDQDETGPQSLGQNFFRFDEDVLADGQMLHVAFDGEDGPAWYALLVATKDSQVESWVRIETDEVGVGEGDIETAGGDLYLVVTPQDPDARGMRYNWDRAPRFGYTWTAEARDIPEPLDSDSGLAGDSGTGGVLHPKFCACNVASHPRSFAGLLGLALLAIGVRRRR